MPTRWQRLFPEGRRISHSALNVNSPLSAHWSHFPFNPVNGVTVPDFFSLLPESQEGTRKSDFSDPAGFAVATA